ncbi:MAG: HU family DNA-binding protein [Candidatus Andersenbacteria bacterium]|nr:HU family DNA-binding protein [Candidatus Andersenbacteria bacterium]MBI3250734.1 HU family DNA-binding protein [Candidatus Andersenbacteria bacterium]
MNKQSLIDRVSDITRKPKKEVEEIVDTFVETIIEKLSMDEKINLSGFGVFEVRERKGRKGVDPRTLKPTQIPTVRVAKFRPGKTLKEAVK